MSDWKSKKLWRHKPFKKRFNFTEIEELMSDRTYEDVFHESRFYEYSMEQKALKATEIDEKSQTIINLSREEFFNCNHVTFNCLEMLSCMTLSVGQMCEILTFYNIDYDILEDNFEGFFGVLDNLVSVNKLKVIEPLCCLLEDQTKTNWISNHGRKPNEDANDSPLLSLSNLVKNFYDKQRGDPKNELFFTRLDECISNLLRNFSRSYPMDVNMFMANYVTECNRVSLVPLLRKMFQAHNPLDQFGYFDSKVLQLLGLPLEVADPLVRTCDCGCDLPFVHCKLEKGTKVVLRFMRKLDSSKTNFENENYEQALQEIDYCHSKANDIMMLFATKQVENINYDDFRTIHLNIHRFNILKKLGWKREALLTCIAITNDLNFRNHSERSTFLMFRDLLRTEVFGDVRNRKKKPSAILEFPKFPHGIVRQVAARRIFQRDLTSSYREKLAAEGGYFPEDHFLFPISYDSQSSVLVHCSNNTDVIVLDIKNISVAPPKRVGLYRFKKSLGDDVKKLFIRGQYFVAYNEELRARSRTEYSSKFVVMNWVKKEKVMVERRDARVQQFEIFDQSLLFVQTRQKVMVYNLLRSQQQQQQQQHYEPVFELLTPETTTLEISKMCVFEDSVFLTRGIGVIEYKIINFSNNEEERITKLEKKNVFIFDTERKDFAAAKMKSSVSYPSIDELYVTKDYVFAIIGKFFSGKFMISYSRKSFNGIKCYPNLPGSFNFHDSFDRFVVFSERGKSDIHIFDLYDGTLVHKIRNVTKKHVLLSFSNGIQSTMKKKKKKSSRKPEFKLLSVGKSLEYRVFEIFVDFKKEKEGREEDNVSVQKKSKNKKCNCCGIEKIKMSVCGRCRKVYYCNRECQILDWKNDHKVKCGKE